MIREACGAACYRLSARALFPLVLLATTTARAQHRSDVAFQTSAIHRDIGPVPSALTTTGYKPPPLGQTARPIAKVTSGTVWSLAGAAGGLLIGVLIGESIRQGTASGDSTTDAYNAKMAPTVGLGLIVPLGAALGAAYGVTNIGESHGNKNAVKGVALATAYLSAAIVIASKVKRDDPALTRFKPSSDIYVPLPIAVVLSSLAAALITDAATTR